MTIQQAFTSALGHHQAGRMKQAEEIYRQILVRDPNHADSIHLLGVLAHQAGRNDIAADLIRRAIAILPNFPDAHYNLGKALQESGRPDEAMIAYHDAIAQKADYAQAHNNLGNILRDKGQLDEAIAEFRAAMAHRANYAEALNNLGNALKASGELDEAISAFRQAIAIKPGFARAHSNLVYTLVFHPAYDARAIADELAEWDRRQAQPLRKFIPSHANDRSPDRRLRIGYLSPHFQDHCQALFTIPVLCSHDPEQVEMFCYSDSARSDSITRRLQSHAKGWREIARKSDEQVAALIREDRIDILVDLTMHMGGNRLLLFARKPAPVQVCWLAYPGSTGLKAIDYRLSDPYLDPPGMDETVYSEKAIRLPDSFWCYDPLDGREITIGPLPAHNRGFITFACLNNFCKINDATLSLWAHIMRRLPDSRLILLAPHGSHRQRTLDVLAGEGIANGRMEFVPFQPRRDFLQLFNRIDIGLDSFPYNGHTTSLDSFWMGVPVITLVGQTALARGGWCMLSNLGLGELAADSAEEYADKAVRLAEDVPRLSELRSTLRQRMEGSPLMDGAKFARNMEEAYREMWRAWCEKRSG